MMFDYNKDLNFFDDAIPFEKDIYLDMLIARLQNSGSNNNYNETSLPRKEEFEK